MAGETVWIKGKTGPVKGILADKFNGQYSVALKVGNLISIRTAKEIYNSVEDYYESFRKATKK